MKKLKRLKRIQEILDEYSTEMKNELDKARKEHQKIILEANSKLISEIAKGEELDESRNMEIHLDLYDNKVCESGFKIPKEK